MEKIKLPELPEAVVRGMVIVQSSDLKDIVKICNALVSAVNSHHDIISKLIDDTQALLISTEKLALIAEENASTIASNSESIAEVRTTATDCRNDITKIAKILEELYEA